jgi:hypothetical protein
VGEGKTIGGGIKLAVGDVEPSSGVGNADGDGVEVVGDGEQAIMTNDIQSRTTCLFGWTILASFELSELNRSIPGVTLVARFM